LGFSAVAEGPVSFTLGAVTLAGAAGGPLFVTALVPVFVGVTLTLFAGGFAWTAAEFVFATGFVPTVLVTTGFVTTGLALIVPVEVVCPVFVFSGKLPLFTVGLGDEVGAGFCGLTTFAVAVLPAAVFGPDG